MATGSLTGVSRRLPLTPLMLLAVSSLALAGCFGGKISDANCNEVAEYQLARSVPPVVAPEGLQAPARGSAYVVPPPGPNAEVVGAACLARPPDYFKAPVTAPPAPQPTPQPTSQPTP